MTFLFFGPSDLLTRNASTSFKRTPLFTFLYPVHLRESANVGDYLFLYEPVNM